jgi:hypothetical protein
MLIHPLREVFALGTAAGLICGWIRPEAVLRLRGRCLGLCIVMWLCGGRAHVLRISPQL